MGRACAISMSVNANGFPIGAAIAGLLVASSVEATVLVAVASCIAGASLACG